MDIKDEYNINSNVYIILCDDHNMYVVNIRYMLFTNVLIDPQSVNTQRTGFEIRTQRLRAGVAMTHTPGCENA